jgi:hypothetical protein
VFRIIFLLLLLIQCTLFDSESKKKDERKKALNALYVIAYNINTNDCRTHYGSQNILFSNNEYYSKVSKTGNYKTIIVGDSTMDISTRYEGFLGSESFSYAISGNTSCDYIEQLNIIKTIPETVLIATNDGNGLLRAISVDVINKTNKDLVNQIRAKWHNVKVHAIGIHPTRADYANRNKDRVNEYMKSLVDCYIDPAPLFTIDSDGRASIDNMLPNDAIHYNKDMSFEIKKYYMTLCGGYL